MAATIQDIIKDIWVQVHATPFDLKKLASAVIRDCGVDAAGLTASDLELLFYNTLEDRWPAIAFAFDEALACASLGPIDGAEFVEGVFMALFLGEAIRHGSGGWDRSFDKICQLICHNLHRGDTNFRMAFFENLLQGLEHRGN